METDDRVGYPRVVMCPAGLAAVQWATHAATAHVQHVCVNHRGRDILVAE